jgi:cellulose biosynthesis protein BcsQ
VCKYQKVSDIGNSLYNWGKDYDKILAEKKEAERKAEEARLEAERKAEEERQRLEAERLEAERKAEEERLEAERKAEEERLEAERKAEEERLEAERKAAEEERIRLEEEKRAEEERIAARRSNPDIYVFVSGGNREGGTSAGIAFAKNGFVDDYNVLYLDLKQFSGMGRFFATINAETSYSKVLEKAGKDELSIDDIEKAISKDDTIGVDFINNKDCAFELVMLGDKGFENLVKKIGEMVKYDAIVISIENTISQMNLAVINAAKKVIFVGSGQQESNNHIERVVDVVRKYDEVNGTDNVHKINILYNRFVKRNCSVLRLEGVNVLGNLDNIKEKTEMRVVEIMSKMPVFRQIAE